jgi:DNA helicase-2/ATP-dependent DNA helicase PcrA
MLAGDEVAGAACNAHGSVMAVGDDDQSIYAFRGARVGNMADFVREFDVQHQIKLEQNYRSYSNILDSANAPHQPQQPPPGQEPAHRPGRGRAGARVRGHQRPAEAQWMVDEIKQLVQRATALSARKSPCSTAATRKAG